MYWYPKKITATKAEDIEVTNYPTIVARLVVDTADIEVSIKNESEEVWPVLTGAAEDEFLNNPMMIVSGLTLSFSGAGSAYVLYQPAKSTK